MLYCINIIKSNQIKRELRTLTNNSLKTFLITLLSLILPFSISCKSNGDPNGGGGGTLTDGVYVGTVNRTALTGSMTGSAPEYTTIDNLYFTISNNKLTIGNGLGTFMDVEILKSGSTYSASDESIIDADSGVTNKQDIKFTVSSDGNSIEILEYTSIYSTPSVEMFKITFKGTLTKQ